MDEISAAVGALIAKRLEEGLKPLAQITTLAGPQGEKGQNGERGEQGERGAPGRDGIDGAPGIDGRNGTDGRDGRDGRDGIDGSTPEIEINDKKTRLRIRDPQTGKWGAWITLGQHITQVIGGGGGSGSSSPSTPETYTNATPTPVTIGGIASGSTFAGKTMTEMLDLLLYPYQSPTFSSFAISGQATTVEAGTTITAGAKTFTWGTTNGANITANTLAIDDLTDAVSLAAGLADDSTEAIAIPTPIQINGAGAHVWRITGTNSNAINFTRDFTVNWQYMKYHGKNIAASLTEADIEALATAALSATQAGTYSFTTSGAPEHLWIAYPALLGALSSFLDVNTGFPVPFEAPQTVSVTNALGVTTNYSAYRSTNQVAGAFTIAAS